MSSASAVHYQREKVAFDACMPTSSCCTSIGSVCESLRSMCIFSAVCMDWCILCWCVAICTSGKFWCSMWAVALYAIVLQGNSGQMMGSSTSSKPPALNGMGPRPPGPRPPPGPPPPGHPSANPAKSKSTGKVSSPGDSRVHLADLHGKYEI